MVDRTLRVRKERLLAPLAVRLRGVNPTAVTFIAFGVGLGAALLVGFGHYGWGCGLWLLNRLIDGLDGEIARRHGAQSDLGGYLDILCDLVVYAAVPLALVLSSPTEAPYTSLTLLLASFYLNVGSWMYLSSLLEKRNKHLGNEKTSVTMPSGLVEGAETIGFYTLFLLFPEAFVPLALTMTGLVLVTVSQRVVWATRVLEEA